MFLVCLLVILTLKSYTGLQKASKRRRSAFGVHLFREEAKEGQRKTMMHLNWYFGAKIWLLVYNFPTIPVLVLWTLIWITHDNCIKYWWCVSMQWCGDMFVSCSYKELSTSFMLFSRGYFPVCDNLSFSSYYFNNLFIGWNFCADAFFLTHWHNGYATS